MSKVIVIMGFGPGTATAVADRFGAEGFSVALVARNEERLAAGVSALNARGITAFGFQADAADSTSIRAAMRSIRSQMGPIAVLHWNAYGGLDVGDLLTADPAALRGVFDVAVFGLLAAIDESLADLKRSDNGAILVSNGGFGEISSEMDEMAANQHFMGIALASAAKHKLVGLLAPRLKGEGIYVGEVTTYGTVKGTPSGTDGSIDPTLIAGEFWRLYQLRSETRGSVRLSESTHLSTRRVGKIKVSPNIVLRPLTAADTKARASLRSILAPHKGELRGTGARAAFDAIMQGKPQAKNVAYAPDTIAGVPGVWCRPADATKRTVLYLHGGWFVSGSADAYRNFVGQIAAQAGAAAFIADYRLAPEHPFPAAVEDVRAAYQGIVDRGFSDVTIAGDSAGGALALELLAWIVRDPRRAPPKGAVLLSPVTDLSLSGVTWESRDAVDPLFTKEQARQLVASYLGDADPALAFSVLEQDFAGFPPIRIHVGDDEVLLDDSLRLAQRAEDAGVDVRLDVWEGMIHVFPSDLGTFEAANRALDEIAAFIRR